MAKIHAAVRMISIGEDPFSPHLSKVDFVCRCLPNRRAEVHGIARAGGDVAADALGGTQLRGFPEDRRAVIACDFH